MRRMATRVVVIALTVVGLALPAAAGGNIFCEGWKDGVRTWGWTSQYTTHGHVINGLVTYRTGEFTAVNHPEPPSVAGWNSWDVIYVSNEGASCHVTV